MSFAPGMSMGDGMGQMDPSAMQEPAGDAPFKPMTESQLGVLIGQLIAENDNSMGSTSTLDRRAALRAFFGMPYGNEIEGRSAIVMTDFADTVEWILPSIMQMLVGSGQLWKFSAAKPQDRIYAEQADQIVNALFLDHSDGWMILNDWVKTALIERTGVVRPELVEMEEPREYTYEGLTEIQLGLLLAQNPDLELIEMDEHVGAESVVDMQTGEPMRFADVTLKRVTRTTKLNVNGIPPEEFSISRNDTRLDDSTTFANFRREMTIGELLALGYDVEKLKYLPESDNEHWGSNRIYRHWNRPWTYSAQTHRPDRASRKVWVNDSIMRVDLDGDGYSEMVNVVSVGSSIPVILEITRINFNTFCAIQAIPVPHRFEGMSIHDLMGDLQLLRSMLVRNLMDNIYQLNNVRHAVVEGQVEMDDMLESQPGGVVRVTAPGMIEPLITPQLPPHTYEMLGFIDETRESRTGVSKWMSGPNPDSLKRQTSSGISNVQSASTTKIKQIARTMAETGIKQLGKTIYRLLVEGHAKPLMLRVGGEYIEVNPGDWPEGMQCTVEVGLGVGESQERIGNLSVIAEWQERMVKSGLGNMVTPQNVYETSRAMVEAMGMKADVARFFTDPQGEPWPQPQPSVEDQVRVAEQQRRVAEDQADDQTKKLSLLIEGERNDNLARFRYVEMEGQERRQEKELAARKEIAEEQVAGQIRSAMIAATRQGESA